MQVVQNIPGSGCWSWLRQRRNLGTTDSVVKCRRAAAIRLESGGVDSFNARQAMQRESGRRGVPGDVLSGEGASGRVSGTGWMVSYVRAEGIRPFPVFQRTGFDPEPRRTSVAKQERAARSSQLGSGKEANLGYCAADAVTVGSHCQHAPALGNGPVFSA